MRDTKAEGYMKDTYKNFKSLLINEKEGLDFKIYTNTTNPRLAIIAPHGGGIEPGTSEIARSIAGEDFTYYLFVGIKSKENKKYLHITSTNFDEPECIELCNITDKIFAIHGVTGSGELIYVGGRDEKLKNRIIKKLYDTGFNAVIDTTHHSGQDIENICNKGIEKIGLQLEISKGLRIKMFRSLNRHGRKHPTRLFEKFVKSIRTELK